MGMPDLRTDGVTSTRLYNRALHPDDYDQLQPWTAQVLAFESRLRTHGIPFRKDHEHRTWEYANVLQQLEDLGPRRDPNGPPIYVLDTGAGGSSLAPLLAERGYRVIVSDSMAYGDIVDPFIVPQCRALNLHIPVLNEPVEAMPTITDGLIDVTLCISVIEHVGEEVFEQGLRELARVTKPGGLIFITSDFFENRQQADDSPFRSIQHTIFTPEFAALLPQLMGAEFVGPYDFRYRGDYVHNYSFVNFCLRKR